ncbi:MAG: type II secretion system protein GspG [Phycisphaerales bacterium]|nr:type II secretion system protein GspG [Phycisphaerales bacterium]
MLNQFHNKLLVAASTLACITPLCVATEPYTRVEDHPNGEVVLEMCTRTFVPTDENAPRVHLVSAIHIADKPYYEAMQDLLNSYDTVLFEGVKPAGLDPIDPGLDDEAKIEATRERLRLLVQVATMYRAEHGDYPQSMKELAESDDHRIQSLVSSVRLDGWGNTIGTMRETTTSNGVTTMTMGFTSFGADGQLGGEGVNADLSETTEPIDPSAKPKQSPEGIQTQLANALRVSFQLDEMDTTNPNWINADMDVNELQHALSEYGEDSLAILDMLGGESISAKIAGFILGFVERSPQLSSMMKLMMMDLLAFAETSDLLQQQGDAMHQVIVVGRNQVVIEDLKATIDAHPEYKDIAIFYGAGHMAGLENDLVEMGYEPGEDYWVEAMRVNTNETGLNAVQVKMMRNMIKSSLQQQMGR